MSGRKLLDPTTYVARCQRVWTQWWGEQSVDPSGVSPHSTSYPVTTVSCQFTMSSQLFTIIFLATAATTRQQWHPYTEYHVWFQTSVAPLWCHVTWVGGHRHFMTICRPKKCRKKRDPWRWTGRLSRNVGNYQCALRNVRQERRFRISCSYKAVIALIEKSC